MTVEYPDMRKFATTLRPCWTAPAMRQQLVEPLHPTAESMRVALAEVMTTLRRLGCAGVFPARVRSNHPEIIRLASECYGVAEAQLRQRRPTSKEISRMDAFLPFLAAMVPEERIAATGVALGLSLRKLGRTLGLSYETVRSRERDGIAHLLQLVQVGTAAPPPPFGQGSAARGPGGTDAAHDFGISTDHTKSRQTGRGRG